MSLDWGQTFWKFSILVNIYENRDLVQIHENLDFGQNCRKFWIWVKIWKNVDFGQKIRKCWFKS